MFKTKYEKPGENLGAACVHLGCSAYPASVGSSPGSPMLSLLSSHSHFCYFYFSLLCLWKIFEHQLTVRVFVRKTLNNSVFTQRSVKIPMDFCCCCHSIVQAVQKLTVLAQAVLKPMEINLPQSLKFQDYRYEPLCLTGVF